MKTFKIFLVLMLFNLISVANANAETKYWNKFGSSWEIKNSIASTVNGYANPWGYYELTNYNSILSIDPIKDFSDIEVIANITERVETPAEFLISFNVTSETQKWYYHMYAFKFTGGYWGLNKVSFIFTDRLDKTRPMDTKNNTFVKELGTADFKIKYEKMYTYRISFEGADIALYINDEKVISAPFPEKSHDGLIAVSAKNAKIAIDKIEVKKENKVIFKDDFNEDSILVRVLKVTREITPKAETEKKKE